MPESFHFLTLRSNIPKLKIWIENANTYASCFGTPMLQKFNLVEYCKACNTHRKRFDPAKNDCPNVSQNRIRLRHQRNETGDINQQNSEEDAEKNASSLPLNGTLLVIIILLNNLLHNANDIKRTFKQKTPYLRHSSKISGDLIIIT